MVRCENSTIHTIHAVAPLPQAQTAAEKKAQTAAEKKVEKKAVKAKPGKKPGKKAAEKAHQPEKTRKPARPPTSYNRFTQANAKAAYNEISQLPEYLGASHRERFAAAQRLLSLRWARLSPNTKSTFTTEEPTPAQSQELEASELCDR